MWYILTFVGMTYLGVLASSPYVEISLEPWEVGLVSSWRDSSLSGVLKARL